MHLQCKTVTVVLFLFFTRLFFHSCAEVTQQARARHVTRESTGAEREKKNTNKKNYLLLLPAEQTAVIVRGHVTDGPGGRHGLVKVSSNRWSRGFSVNLARVGTQEEE